MNTVIIRHSENADIPAIQKLFSYSELSSSSSLPLFQSRDEIRQKISQNNPYACSLVACQDGDVVGHLLLEPESEMQRRHAASFSLCVTPEHHGEGIGSALMQAMLVICDQYWALERIELIVFADNNRAVNLYKKFGFETEGICRKFSLRDGVLNDVYRMVRFRSMAK